MPQKGPSGGEDGRRLNRWQNNYHRPNFPWVCGNASLGDPCWTGPTPAGKCGCRGECYPVSSQGHWVCSRPAHRGGACEEGPTADGKCCLQRPPCVPRMSWPMFRKRISAALLCCLIGVGLIIVGSRRTQDVIVPGPLSSPHAERLTHFGNDRCASCHPQAHQSVGKWLTGWLDSDSNSTVTQTDLCLKCHQRDLCESFALVAHNVAPSELESLTRKALDQNTGPATDPASGRQTRRVDAQPPAWNADAIPAFAKNGTTNTPQTLACATCHREHHGQAVPRAGISGKE